MKSASETLKSGKKLLKRYLSALTDESTAEHDRWLKDNAAMLMSCIENGIGTAKKYDGETTAPVLSLLLACVKKTEPNDVKRTFKKSLDGADIPLELCSSVAVLSFAAAALNAVERYGDAPDGFGGAVRIVFGMRDIDFDELLPAVCEAERLLTLDPSGDYAKCDKITKEGYRRAVCRNAKKAGINAVEYLKNALAKASECEGAKRHIGFHIGLTPPEKSHGTAFLCAELIAAVGVTVVTVLLFTRSANGFFGTVLGKVLTCLIVFLPVISSLRPISNRIAARLFPPCFLPSFDPEETDSLPPTAIAVSSVLPSADKIKDVKEQLLNTKLTDASPDTVLVYLCDPKTAEVPSLPEDAADIRAAKQMIAELNDRCGGGFVLAVRDRVFAPSENSYGGYERKRGAICTLVKLITDGANGFSVLEGDTDKLKSAKYLLALDADTVLPFESLKKLVCTAYHPLNRPIYSAEKRRIESGYGIVAPRVETSAASSEKTFFSSFMTLGGISAYSSPVSERYMDMFASSLFTGKGLIDIEAFSKVCLNAFPDGLILSHDIPEGALLNTAFAGGISLSDSFPSKPSAFRKREHRWIRGDIQNLHLLHGTTNGSPSAPEMTALAKYQLADNVRRALTPSFTLVSLILSVFTFGGVSRVLFLWAIFSVVSEPVISFFGEAVRLGAKALTSMYLTASAGVGLKSLLRALYLAAALPESAAVSLSACAKGFYRGFVSRRKTLEWTTAAQSEHIKSAELFPCAVSVAVAAVLMTASPIHRLWGTAVLLNIPFSFSNGIKNVKTSEKLTDTERETLKSYAAAEWRYFEKYVTSEDNMLPPDNVQLAPVKRIAHRTSPTDIGMYLMSCLTAADLSLITENELFDRLLGSCETLKKLRRCNGLLYNWYDTQTLDVLAPFFVSTVDCGNYLCCLVTLKEGLKKLSGGGNRFSPVIDFIDSEISSSDLGILFSKRRGLFSVGINGADKTQSTSFYDTYMSEMRLTSYYAIAMREVPVSHNEKLSRAAVSSGPYTSAASWTGTAFEYLMPSLFLPIFDGTFLSEALYNCVREQKKRSRSDTMPWGISESGYYAFDRDLNYKYKAHGLQNLALKAQADSEDVFSPYSSFLALAVAPHDAVKNLSRFVSLGAFGVCGFYEAVDCTPQRVSPEKRKIVSSFMAHHKGMSLIACANALFGNINVRRFTSNGLMKAAESLLTERLPTEVPFSARIKKRRADSVRNDSARDDKKAAVRSPRHASVASRCSLYSAGDASLICTSDGRNRFLYSSLSVLGSRSAATGIFAAVRSNGKTVPLSHVSTGELKPTGYYGKAAIDGATAEHAVCLSRTASGILAPVKLSETAGKGGYYEMLFFAEPELTSADELNLHKSYSDLFVTAQFHSGLNCVTFERRKNGAVVAAAAFGFADSEPFVFTCDKTRVLTNSSTSPFPFADGTPVFDNTTASVSPCFAASIGLRLSPCEKREKVLIATAGDDRTDAINKLSVLRSNPLPRTNSSEPTESAFAEGIRKTAEEYMLSRFFGTATSPARSAAQNKNTLPLASLWEKGISGDFGIVRANVDDTPPSICADLIAFHDVFAKAGCPFDLIFTLFSPDDYSSEAANKLKNIAKKHGSEAFLGARGGIHIANICSGSESDIMLTAVADALFPCEQTDDGTKENRREYTLPTPAERAVTGEDGFIPNGYFINSRPSFPMSLTLSNGILGTLLTNTSLGFTWFANARLCPLTPRPYDASEPMRGEMLTLVQEGKSTDCILGSSVFFTSDSAVYRSVINGMRCDVKVTVAAKGAIKDIAVSLSGIRSRLTLVFTVTPLLHEKTEFAKMCAFNITEDGVTVRNPFNADYRGYMTVSCENATAKTYSDGKIALTVGIGEETEHFQTVFRMSFSAREAGIKPLTELKSSSFVEPKPRFSTGISELDTFANALLYHQAADSRIRSRTGYYQCSGAYGFRDQLQDALCTVRFSPKTTRRIILLCAAAQFTEGDVLHWFHLIPSAGKKGVRTRCSDDMLWLPFAASVYAEKTGDSDIFTVSVPYVDGEKLKEGEKQRYDLFRRSAISGTVYEHCIKSVFKACVFGAHGLPLIKDGDWNDSFGEIGDGGKGESVWLAMFLKIVCDRMLPYVHRYGSSEQQKLIKQISAQMSENIMKFAYNGTFFTRAFFDDGTPLGDGGGSACRIDLLPQSFASFAKIGTPEQRRKALNTAYSLLADEKNGIIKLFSPPFTQSTRRAGYVNDYPAGVRENGGQYTHAAVWFAIALLNEGMTRQAAQTTAMLLPSLKSGNYGREPYALCGDVYSMTGAEGKGGWSLYTGAAGWMLVLAEKWEQTEKHSNKEKTE